MTPPETITALQIVLRRVTPGDAQDLFRLASDREVMRYMDWPIPEDPESVRAHLESAAADWNAGSEYQWVILERATAEVIGGIACRPKGDAADFGYFLARSHWGRGLALDAASLVVAWAAAQPRMTRIWASADEENIRSRRLLERLGFQLESVLRGATFRPNIGGAPRNTVVYARRLSGDSHIANPI